MAKQNYTTKTFISDNNTRVANHWTIETPTHIYLKSYNSIVVRYNKTSGTITLGVDWCYSMTTKKYVKQFIHRMIGTYYFTAELHDTFSVKSLYV